MKYKFNRIKIEPCLYSCNNIVTEINEEFTEFTGFKKEVLLGKTIMEIGALIKINSQILLQNTSSKYCGYIFTKSLSAREVTVFRSHGKDTNEEVYTFLKNQIPDLMTN